MADNQVVTTLMLQADKQSAAATQRLLAEISGDLKDLGKGDQLRDLQKSFKQLPDGAKTLSDRIKQGVGNAQDLVKTYDDLIEREKRLTAAGEPGPARKGKGQDEGPRTRIEQFEEVEQTSGKVGDLGDALAALGQATGIGALGDVGALFEGIEALARAKAGFEALPETLDATAKSVGLFRSAQSATTATTTAATAAETAQAAANTGVAASGGAAAVSMGGLLLALGPIAIVGAAVVAAVVLVKGALDAHAAAAEENAAKVKRAYEATDTVFDAILGGATSSDARKKVADEQAKLEQANEQYLVAFQQSNQRYTEILEKYGFLAAEAAKNRGTDELAVFAERMKEQGEEAKQAQASINEYNKALKENKFAAADAKEAEEKLEDERKKAEVEAERRAKEIESVQERIADSERKYSERQEDNARQAGQRLSDINRATQDKQIDTVRKNQQEAIAANLEGRREEIDAQIKIGRETLDANIKARQAELDGVLKHNRSLEDIEKNARRSESQSLKERNFLQTALIGESTQEQIEDANTAAEREAADRLTQQERERQELLLGWEREAIDRKTSNDRSRFDRKIAMENENKEIRIAHERSLRDAQIQISRQDEQTKTAYLRESTQLQEHLNELLGIRGTAYEAERALASGARPENVLRGVTSTNNTSSSSITDNRSLVMNLNNNPLSDLTRHVERTVLQTMQKVSYR